MSVKPPPRAVTAQKKSNIDKFIKKGNLEKSSKQMLLTIWVSPEFKQRIDDHCKSTYQPISGMIRRAILEFLENYDKSR